MVAEKSGERADIFPNEGGCQMLLASQVVKSKIKGSHYSTESMFDFSETMLNVSSWAAKITVFYFCSEAQHKLVMLVMSINQLITKAISVINIPTFYKVVVQW